MLCKSVNGKFQIRCTYGRRYIVPVVVLALLALLVQGCGPKDVRTLGAGTAPTEGQISKEDLREQIDNFSEFFKSTLRQAAGDLNERLKTPRAEKTTLQMRARMVQALNAMTERDDPVVAFIETWALCVRLRMYLKEGEGGSLYGDAQNIAVGAVGTLEDEIERIGLVFLKEDVFDATRKNINEFAAGHPIKGTFSNTIVYATEMKKGVPNPFLNVVRIPMSPFRAMEGVDRTATAVHQFRDTAEHFSDIVSELPESSRWQLLLLLYDLQETEMTKSFLTSLERFSESSARLAETSEKLPERLREQMTLFVEEIDKKQANLQTSLDKAEKTATALTATLEKLDETANSLDTLAGGVTETAAAWQAAAEATTKTVQEFAKSRESDKPDSSFTLTEYRQAIEQTSQAAADLESLIAHVNHLAESRAFESLIDHLTLRLVELVLLLFALALLYRIILIRMKKPKAANART
jgi:allophanate hydrolase subunit 1